MAEARELMWDGRVDAWEDSEWRAKAWDDVGWRDEAREQGVLEAETWEDGEWRAEAWEGSRQGLKPGKIEG